MEEELRGFLKTGKNWERTRTKTQGLFIRKMPGSLKKESFLAIELNPPDPSGNPTKKNGIFIRSRKDLETYRALLATPQIERILEVLAVLNPASESDRVLDI